jgi:hypothetical protein
MGSRHATTSHHVVFRTWQVEGKKLRTWTGGVRKLQEIPVPAPAGRDGNALRNEAILYRCLALRILFAQLKNMHMSSARFLGKLVQRRKVE